MTGETTRLRAFKTELDPNNVQRSTFVRYAGAARFVYNWALADRIASYQAGAKTNLYEQKRRFNALKREQFPWLYEIAYVVQQEAFANLDAAYQAFFRRVRAGEKSGFPRFKSRKHGIGSFCMRGCITIESSRIKLPRIGWVKLKERDYLPTSDAKVLSVTVSERAGRWYASAQVEMVVPAPQPAQGTPLGVDLGLKSLAVCSDGTVFDNPRSLDREQRKLKRLQRELSRRQRGSKNRERTRRKLARCHARIASVRTHALHQVSHQVTAKTKPGVVVLEDLNASGMMANHKLARAIGDASFRELRRQIEYKAAWCGTQVVVADRFYPSSKTCSVCGCIRASLSLSERVFVCDECGARLDRDLNAARNLAALGERTVKHTGIACGVGVQ